MSTLESALKSASSRGDFAFQQGIKQAESGSVGPSAITNAMSSGGGIFGGQQQSIRTHAEQYKHGKKGWSFASVRPIANRAAAQTLHVARVAPMKSQRSVKGWHRDRLPVWVKQAQGELEVLEQHPLLDAVAHPNDLMVQWSLAWLTVAGMQFTGKAFWWFTEQDGRLQIWPIPSHWIEPDHSESFRGQWKVRPEGATEAIRIPGNEVCPFYLPDPANPLGAHAPLAAAGRPILSDDAIHEAQFRSFQNDTMPAVAFKVGKVPGPNGTMETPELSEPQRQQLETRIRQLFGGVHKHGRFIVLDRTIEGVEKISMSPSEMDFMQSAAMTKKEIMQIFGVNPIIAGEIEDANRASATVADEIFCANVVNPLLTLMGQVLTRFVNGNPIFARGTERVVAYYDECEANDPEEQRERMQWAYDRGIVSDDDYRQHMLGLPPKDDGAGGDMARINAMLVQVPVYGPMPEVQIDPERQAGPRGQREHYRRLWLKQHEGEERRLAADVAAYFPDAGGNGRPRLPG